MSDIFDEDADGLIEEVASDDFVVSDDEDSLNLESVNETPTLDARRRLENMLEERRLRAELDDGFDDY